MKFNDIFSEIKTYNTNILNKRYKSLDKKNKTNNNILTLVKSLNKEKDELIKSKEKQYNIYNDINMIFQKKYVINKINKSNTKEINDIKKEIYNIKKEINDINENTMQLNNEYNMLKKYVDEMNIKNIEISEKINKIIEMKKIFVRLLLNIKNETDKLVIINCIKNDKIYTSVNNIHKYLEKNIN